MPNIEGEMRQIKADVCVGALPLPVLGAGGAFAGCRALEVSRTDDVLGYRLMCDARGTARAVARYRVGPTGYSGRVEITMGGKSMTMTEHQSARRIGPCEP